MIIIVTHYFPQKSSPRNRLLLSMLSFILVSMLLACSKKGNNYSPTSLDYMPHVIMVDESQIKDESFSDEFCDFTFIPIEMTRESLLTGIRKLVATKNGFYVFDSNPGSSIIHLNPDGAYQCKIGAVGHAKNEYTRLTNMGATSTGDTVAVIDFLRQIQFYDSTGKYLFSKDDDEIRDVDDILISSNGYYLATFLRSKNNMLTCYDKNFQEKATKITLDTLKFYGFWNTANSQCLQENNESICCLDVFSSTFHILKPDASDDINSYVLSNEWMLTNERAYECGIHDEKYGRVFCYVLSDDNVIRGVIRTPSMRLIDFRLNLETAQLELIRHLDNNGYLFACYHNGYFYQIWEPTQILHMIDPENEPEDDKKLDPHMYRMREMLMDAIEPIKESIQKDDNPYILRMRLKQ